MGCSGCSTGRGNGTPAGCNNNGACGVNGGCNKLNVFDWLANMRLPVGQSIYDVVEIGFKNTRKEYFKNSAKLPLKIGDVVAVETQSGHDIGTVSLTGELVRIQLKRKGLDNKPEEFKKIYRLAKEADIEKWHQAVELEQPTMVKARQMATGLKLNMKISDVEFQGDKSKATFFYTADDRVDFRELIKLYAEEFKVKIEMKQIGTRQEAGRVGGIGSCGRELCCSTWLTDFRTVNTSAARYQQLSLNPQKLAGQCGKLKCCLNYELDSYVDAVKDFPESNIRLETKSGLAFHFKSDIFKRQMVFNQKDENGQEQFYTFSIERVKEMVELNKKGIKLERLDTAKPEKPQAPQITFQNVVGQDSITRFDKQNTNKSKNKNKNRNKNRPKPANGNPNSNTNPNNPPRPNLPKPNPPKSNPS